MGKLLTHQRYLESGLFEETYGCKKFKTLVVTTGERRLRNLKTLLEEQQSSLFWFTNFSTIRRHSIDGLIWEVPFGNTKLAML